MRKAALLISLASSLALATGRNTSRGGTQPTSEPAIEATGRQAPRGVTPALRREILSAREKVWRAWFSNDQRELEALIPEETIAINAGEEHWGNRDSVLSSAREFAKNGGKLVRLEFPQTEVQLYGDVAILYSIYRFETENCDGKQEATTGRATEIFVHRNGQWLNPGWHLDSGR